MAVDNAVTKRKCSNTFMSWDQTTVKCAVANLIDVTKLQARC